MAREQEKLDELDRRQRAVDQRLKSASRHESRRTAMEIATGVTKPISGSGGEAVLARSAPLGQARLGEPVGAEALCTTRWRATG